MEKKVKGTFFADYVRMMRKRKDIDWSRRLPAEDLAYLGRRVIDSDWYPMGSFERMGEAILAEVAGGDMEAPRQWGRAYLDGLIGVHSSLVSEGDPGESIIRFQVMRRNFFNFDPISVLAYSRNWARIKIHYGMGPIAEQAATFQSLGYFERLLERSGASDVQHKFTARAWEGDPASILELDWSEVPAGSEVKGILFVDYIRMIKSKKGVDWSRYLTPRDLSFLKERIVEGSWYPFETFERMGLAILAEVAEGDFQKVYLWGRNYMDHLFQAHPSLVMEGDCRESLMRFQVLRRSFFNFESVNIRSLLGNYAKLEISYGMCRTAEKAACYQTLGFFERLLELAKAVNLSFKFAAKSWEGDPATILEFNWESEM